MSKRYPGGIIRKTPQTPSQTSAQGVWDMTSVTQAVKENTWPIAGVPDPISRSLRFRSSASAYLNRTQGSATNQYIGTWSFWCKRGTLGTVQRLFEGYTASSDTGVMEFEFAADDCFYVGGWTQNWRVTTQVFRDPSAWYHIVVQVDTTQATANNRIKVYVNGSQVTAFSTTNNPSQNSTFGLNNNSAVLQIGRRRNVSNNDSFFDGYMTEVYFIDGQALTPSSFGTTDDQTGVWEPIAYTGTYGTNGFYLPFSNTASTTTLGYDFSGNSNNFTTNNISLTSGSTYDSMVDVPTQWIPYNTAGDTGALWRGNYCVLNPLDKNTSITASNGNLSVTTPAGFALIRSTMFLPSEKYYWEVTCTTTGNGFLGISSASESLSSRGAETANSATINTANGNLRTSGADSTYGSSVANGDVMIFALDMTSGKFWAGKNGTWFASGNPAAGTNAGKTGLTVAVSPSISLYDNENYSANFGQRPFSYTPPSGFVTLNTRNLPTPTIGATASTTANKYFDATTFDGVTGGGTVTNSGSMQPDFVWMKVRNNANNHELADSVRGTPYASFSNLTNAEVSDTRVSAFNSNGFSYGTNSNSAITGRTVVAWQWRASNTTAVTNTAGTITSTVSANTSAGFSIVTYTGTGANATVGHGLGADPKMIFVKRRNSTSDWSVYFNIDGLGAGVRYLLLNGTGGSVFDTTYWNSTVATSSVFSLGTSSNPNASGGTYVAYCFAEVAGYSKLGSYTGNGSSDGPFVFTGFRPRFILIKNTTAYNWQIWDTSRSPYNQGTTVLFPNSSSADNTTATQFDILSNGFKIRTSDAGSNGSGESIIYACFAENPFKYSLAR